MLALDFWAGQLYADLQHTCDARRLLVVGDVHGSRLTLEALLAEAGFDSGKGDQIIFVGDLVNKGPDTAGVIELAMSHGALAVRGNHDNAVLLAAKSLQHTVGTSQTDGSRPAGAESPENGSSYATAATLSPSQLAYLASLPLMLRLTPTPALSASVQTLVVVHACLVPTVPLEEQDPYMVMHMRSFTSPGGEPAEETGEEGWAVDWNRRQAALLKRTMVVFGHDARRRLQVGEYAIGLDSACVYGGKLSAWVVEGDGEDGVRTRVIQVDCREGGVG